MVFIRSIKPLENFMVRLVFSDGQQKDVDLEHLLRGPIFEPLLRDPELFRAVKAVEELGTIVWPNGAGMDPDVLYGSHLPAWMEVEEPIRA